MAKVAPLSRPADASASQGRSSVAGVGWTAANNPEPLAVAAAAVLGRVSAACPRRRRRGTLESALAAVALVMRATAYPSGGIAFASCSKRTWSPGSSGPARHVSIPLGLIAGRSRPRAIKPIPAVMTLAQMRAVAVVTCGIVDVEQKRERSFYREEGGRDLAAADGLGSAKRQLDGALLTQACELLIASVLAVEPVQAERGEPPCAWRISGYVGDVEASQGGTGADQLLGRDHAVLAPSSSPR